MNRCYGYVRVSTVKQGEKGVSLQEQRDAITRYAEKNRLTIVSWFEEREMAAKRGRPVFGEMLKLLRRGQADGVIIHKIDRSARNLKDWSDLDELIDNGIEIHFANEGLDLNSRGGRPSGLLEHYPILQLITGDAMYAGRPLCELLIANGRHYMFQIKADQPQRLEKMELVFAPQLARTH